MVFTVENHRKKNYSRARTRNCGKKLLRGKLESGTSRGKYQQSKDEKRSFKGYTTHEKIFGGSEMCQRNFKIAFGML